jgi:menaquinone-dependent protoporphyrinogen oxidase
MSSTPVSPKPDSTRSLTRRGFLKVAGVAAGAAVVACSGLSYLAAAPSSQPPRQVDTPEFAFGKENPMHPRLLVTYATRTGSTVGVAAAIGEVLGAKGLAVDVKPIKDSPKVDEYQAVVIGSAVNGGRWLAEAMEYVSDNRTRLQRVPVALFCVHIMNLGADERSRRNRRAYLDSVRALLSAADEAYFPGMGGDPASQSRLERWMSGIFKIPQGDQRDWDSIRGWAAGLQLLQPA